MPSPNNYHRYYSPETGRYITSDPIGLLGGLNTYGYVGGNPINRFDPYGMFGVADLPTFSEMFGQSFVDGVAGFGDELSFGISDKVRDLMGTNNLVNQCSPAYSGGKVAGFAYGLALGWGAGAKAAAKAASANNHLNFSHSFLPNRFLKRFNNRFAKWLNKRGNRLNGDFVSPELHTRMDAAAQFGLSKAWLAANPLFSPARQWVNRIPYVPGAAAYGAGSLAINSNCECE